MLRCNQQVPRICFGRVGVKRKHHDAAADDLLQYHGHDDKEERLVVGWLHVAKFHVSQRVGCCKAAKHEPKALEHGTGKARDSGPTPRDHTQRARRCTPMSIPGMPVEWPVLRVRSHTHRHTHTHTLCHTPHATSMRHAPRVASAVTWRRQLSSRAPLTKPRRHRMRPKSAARPLPSCRSQPATKRLRSASWPRPPLASTHAAATSGSARRAGCVPVARVRMSTAGDSIAQ